MSAAHYQFDNLCVIIDHNGLQIDGKVDDVMKVDSLYDKATAFGCHALQINGHDMDAIKTAFAQARQIQGKPTVIIADTIKGKGVSFMENEAGWHGKAPNATQFEQAIKDLGGKKSRFYLIFPFRLKSRIILYLWAFFELVNTFFFPNFPLNISYFLSSN